MRQELLHRGLVALDGPDVTSGEIWTSGDAAVAFDPQTGGVVATMRGVVKGLSDDGRLLLRGSVDGSDATWMAADPERQQGAWVGMTVRWPGETWEKATVSWSNYRVQVIPQVADSGQPVSLPGARVEMQGGRRFIVAGDTLIAVEQRRGCGCGG